MIGTFFIYVDKFLAGRIMAQKNAYWLMFSKTTISEGIYDTSVKWEEDKLRVLLIDWQMICQ